MFQANGFAVPSQPHGHLKRGIYQPMVLCNLLYCREIGLANGDWIEEGFSKLVVNRCQAQIELPVFYLLSGALSPVETPAICMG